MYNVCTEDICNPIRKEYFALPHLILPEVLTQKKRYVKSGISETLIPDFTYLFFRLYCCFFISLFIRFACELFYKYILSDKLLFQTWVVRTKLDFYVFISVVVYAILSLFFYVKCFLVFKVTELLWLQEMQAYIITS